MLNKTFQRILSNEFPESKCLLNFQEENALLNRMPGNKNTIIYIMVLNAILMFIVGLNRNGYVFVIDLNVLSF